jgi:hypothetical protein
MSPFWIKTALAAVVVAVWAGGYLIGRAEGRK